MCHYNFFDKGGVMHETGVVFLFEEHMIYPLIVYVHHYIVIWGVPIVFAREDDLLQKASLFSTISI